MGKPEHIVILTSVNSRAEAGKLARLLVKEKAAACVSVTAPLESVYWWQGQITSDREWMLFVKTTADSYARVERIISENHPYTVPEIIALPVHAIADPYRRWLEENTQKP